ncbi:MAG: secretion system protein [Micromonosporaceae bacterium]|nr:secretion system protein [Micromonosporaceae bacterium]
MTAVLAVCLVAVALLVAVPVRRRRRPAHRLLGSPAAAAAGSSPPPAVPGATGRRPFGAPRVDKLRCAAVLGGIAVAVLVGGWFGLLAGAGAAAALDRGLRRLPSTTSRAHRLAGAAELPLAADLLAVALRGGAPVDRATAAVAEALPGPLGDRLARVGRVLGLGGTPTEAWAQLGPAEGADRFARAAVRSAEHGSALAGALARLAEDLRADRTVAIDAAAHRAGVLVVLPLGLCFLPAFVLAGLVPVIVAILGDVL